MKCSLLILVVLVFGFNSRSQEVVQEIKLRDNKIRNIQLLKSKDSLLIVYEQELKSGSFTSREGIWIYNKKTSKVYLNEFKESELIGVTQLAGSLTYYFLKSKKNKSELNYFKVGISKNSFSKSANPIELDGILIDARTDSSGIHLSLLDDIASRLIFYSISNDSVYDRKQIIIDYQLTKQIKSTGLEYYYYNDLSYDFIGYQRVKFMRNKDELYASIDYPENKQTQVFKYSFVGNKTSEWKITHPKYSYGKSFIDRDKLFHVGYSDAAFDLTTYQLDSLSGSTAILLQRKLTPQSSITRYGSENTIVQEDKFIPNIVRVSNVNLSISFISDDTGGKVRIGSFLEDSYVGTGLFTPLTVASLALNILINVTNKPLGIHRYFYSKIDSVESSNSAIDMGKGLSDYELIDKYEQETYKKPIVKYKGYLKDDNDHYALYFIPRDLVFRIIKF